MSKKMLITVASMLLLLCLAVVFINNSVSAEKSHNLILRRIVLLQFKDTASLKEINEVENAFCDLASKFSIGLFHFEWGANVSQENMDQGYTHCIMLTFAATPDRDRFLLYASENELDKCVDAHLEKKCVVEYWTKP